ncbi:MAG: uL22 family ribosomal protein [Candidatus Aenigmatarchaeota archaeon]
MEKIAKSKKSNARISIKDANVIFKKLRRRKLQKSINFVKELLARKKDIKGRYYTGACKVILELLEDVKNNAEAKGLDIEKLFIKRLAANKSFTFILPKSRITHRGRRAKLCHLEIEVEER